MRVFHSAGPLKVSVASLKPGDTFEHDSGFYIKTDLFGNGTICCVRLVGGCSTHFKSETGVVPIRFKAVPDTEDSK